MKRLVWFEFKNIWTQLTIISIVSLVAFSSVLNFISFWNSEKAVTGSGEIVTGMGTYRSIKNDMGEIKGVMDQEYFDKLTKEYPESAEKKLLKDRPGNALTKYIFSNYMVNFVTQGLKFNSSHMDLPEEINADEFYKQYKTVMLDVIKSRNRFNWFPYSPENIEKIASKIDNLETPFNVDYYSGISFFNWKFGQQFWFVLLVLAFVLCPIFAKDSDRGISELTLSSKFGRRKNMAARIIAGNIFAVLTYLIFLATLLIEIGIVISFQGVNQSIQNIWNTCIYNLTAGQGMLITMGIGLLSVIIIANLVMLISMLIKFSKISTIASLALIIFLKSSIFSNNSLHGQLNPIGLSSSGMPKFFETFYFIGELVIPYSVFFVILSAIYFVIIRFISISLYKKYKLN